MLALNPIYIPDRKRFSLVFPVATASIFMNCEASVGWCAHATEAIGVRLGSIHTQIVVSACNTWQLYIFTYVSELKLAKSSTSYKLQV